MAEPSAPSRTPDTPRPRADRETWGGARAGVDNRVRPADRAEAPAAPDRTPGPDAAPAPPVKPHPYSWLHLLALVVVAFVLGMLIFMVVMQDPPELPDVEPTGQALLVDPSTLTRPTGE